MIRLERTEAKTVLEWFFKETKESSATRLSKIGEVIYSEIPSHPLRCYLQAVLCYCLGCFDACIAAACMAAEFRLKERMIEELSFQNEVERQKLRPQLDRASYGKLIRLVRCHPTIFKDLASELPEHEAMNRIRTAHLHKNPERWQELYQDVVETITKDFPEPYRETARKYLLFLHSLSPNEKAFEALKKARSMLALTATSNQGPPSVKFERFHQRLFAPLLHVSES